MSALNVEDAGLFLAACLRGHLVCGVHIESDKIRYFLP